MRVYENEEKGRNKTRARDRKVEANRKKRARR
jgi:hypothetical protein